MKFQGRLQARNFKRTREATTRKKEGGLGGLNERSYFGFLLERAARIESEDPRK